MVRLAPPSPGHRPQSPLRPASQRSRPAAVVLVVIDEAGTRFRVPRGIRAGARDRSREVPDAPRHHDRRAAGHAPRPRADPRVGEVLIVTVAPDRPPEDVRDLTHALQAAGSDLGIRLLVVPGSHYRQLPRRGPRQRRPKPSLDIRGIFGAARQSGPGPSADPAPLTRVMPVVRRSRSR